MSKHTPAPWGVRNGTEVFCGSKRVCHVNAASREVLNMLDDQRVAMANARLISTAPELLEAAKDAVDRITSHLSMLNCDDEFITRETKSLRNAIAKATGDKA